MDRIKVTVESIRGECAAGCKVGDVFYYQDGSIFVEDASVRLCAYGLSAVIPFLSGSWRCSDQEDWMSGLKELQCPDAENALLYRIEKID
jgi:uncharacterized repeat protein (TIGR04076 family)